MSSKTTTMYFLVFGMLATGTINTLLNKYQDLQCVAVDASTCDPKHGPFFEQPLLQTLNMFVGEIMCLGLFYAQYLWKTWRLPSGYQPVASENSDDDVEQEDLATNPTLDLLDEKPLLEGWNQLWFLIPTLCDLTATTLMNVGLIFVSASVYQMLRGSVVLFTGTFSTLFLGIKHPRYRWFGLIIVFTGVAIVGTSSLFRSSASDSIVTTTAIVQSSPYQYLGIMMVILAQCFTATQFVVEEKIMHMYRIPSLKAVGLEGFFGLALTALAVPILHGTVGVHYPPGVGNIFDMYERYPIAN
jgi:drug/metabolite transporter (DMT)-like permease